MTSKRYAANTEVSPQRSRMEIEQVLERYGTEDFVYGHDRQKAMIAFTYQGMPVRITMPMPNRDDFQHYERRTNRGVTRLERTESSQENLYRQAERQAWRALLLVIKAKLEAIAAGITTFEQEFLPYMLLPDNTTVSDRIIPGIHQLLEDGHLPELMPRQQGAIALGAPVQQPEV